jgi:hypothetical protein
VRRRRAGGERQPAGAAGGGIGGTAQMSRPANISFIDNALRTVARRPTKVAMGAGVDAELARRRVVAVPPLRWVAKSLSNPYDAAGLRR